MAQRLTSQPGGEPDPLETTGLCLLCFDGGGVRGLSSLYILKGIMTRLNIERAKLNQPPVKPCEVFDLIAGTSTGGLIAIMLGRLKMDVDECIKSYTELAAQVFGQTISRTPFGITGKIKSKFDSKVLDSAVRDVIVSKKKPENAMLNDGEDRTCKTFVCTVDRSTKFVVRLRDYDLPEEMAIQATIRQAALATSAATTFFEPAQIGYRTFADGAFGANNPVDEVEEEAANIWCSETRELKPLVKCFISIGTGNPGLKAFEDNLFKFLQKTLVDLVTETEKTEKKFIARWAKHYDEGRYYRFNVEQGLQDVGLEEYKKLDIIEAATEAYMTHTKQKNTTRDCIHNLKLKQEQRQFNIQFSLSGVPIAKKFIGRQNELQRMSEALLPNAGNTRRKVFVLRGLGGIGKTQLAVEFARKHRDAFSSIFWLDASSEDTLKSSLAACSQRLPEEHVSENGKAYRSGNNEVTEELAQEMIAWFARKHNDRWLVIFDNTDKGSPSSGSGAFDIRAYFPPFDHGSILITTRLIRLEQLGESQEVQAVDDSTAQAILATWLDRDYESDIIAPLIELLDGLPLALAQAGAYLKETGVGIKTYLRYYHEHWEDIARSTDDEDSILQDYPERSIWTTWTISFDAIHRNNPSAANLLVLWSFLNNDGLWYGLFENVRSNDSAAQAVTQVLGDIAAHELSFTRAMRLLCSYSMVQKSEDDCQHSSYSLHPVVHKWAYNFKGKHLRKTLLPLAISVVGLAMNDQADVVSKKLARRALRHMHTCVCLLLDDDRSSSVSVDEVLATDQVFRIPLAALKNLAFICLDIPHVGNPELIIRGPQQPTKMFFTLHGEVIDLNIMRTAAIGMLERELQRFSENLPVDLSVEDQMNVTSLQLSLAGFYTDQGQMERAENCFEMVLSNLKDGFEIEPDSLWCTRIALGKIYIRSGKLEDAERVLEQALRPCDPQLQDDHSWATGSRRSLGQVYLRQGRLVEAEQMFKEEVLRAGHEFNVETAEKLHLLVAELRTYVDPAQQAESGLAKTHELLQLFSLEPISSFDVVDFLLDQMLEVYLFVDLDAEGEAGEERGEEEDEEEAGAGEDEE
ncbi:hypothetical protein K461DRAFT_326006 [Myriangium duriaei CBS 260.36]|uniref:PNPLA domain-containing protein n=1 Tax=Myriangium duriaei CBS 260.36 TaxID=1168546 RepID=A0A9P4MK12_9PEZI|nr:hypothetical protein K461DRAFT_326006 [Myriangium duriaei CBS 260.36]